MTAEEIVEQWRRVTAEVDPETGDPERWEDEPPGWFLHAFRAHPERVPDLFAGLPELAPVAERIGAMFAVCDATSPYCLVIRPDPLPDDEIVGLVREWLAIVKSLDRQLTIPVDDGVAAFFRKRSWPVELAAAPPPTRDPSASHPLETAAYEATTTLGGITEYTSEAGDLLVEPLYMLACRYDLAYWALTPITTSFTGEPFAPIARLWRAGVALSFVGEGRDTRVVAHRSA